MRKLWAFAFLFLLSTSFAAAQSRLVDPFFGIEYDPEKVHFDRMPLLIERQCPELRDHYAKAWVFSHLKTPDIEYFILYGYIKVPSEDHPGAVLTQLEEDDGLIVAIESSSCHVDQWQFFFRKEANPARGATPIKAPDAILNAIAEDLFERYARAFGGKKTFLERVTKQAREELPPILQRQLEVFEKAAGPDLRRK